MSARATDTSVIAGLAGRGVLTDTGAVALRASIVTERLPVTVNWGSMTSAAAPVAKL